MTQLTDKMLIILCGEAFSGKSTLAKKLSDFYNLKIVGRDAIYFATEKMLGLENTPDEDDDGLWKAMWPMVLQGTKNHLTTGNSVVIDDNCLYRKQREELRSMAQSAGANTVLIYLGTSPEILKQRKEENKITKHRHDVPSAWMAEDSNLFERPAEDENVIIFSPDMLFEELTKAIY